jgi:MoaA/NifB/PqqE/SkfB family radical SAM enzyme
MPELGFEQMSSSEKEALLEGMATGATTLAPRTVQIDWTDRCNVDCFFCSQVDMRRNEGELSLDVLERCFAEMDDLGVKTLNLSGGGDPLFHREIASVLAAIRPRAFRIGSIATNAVLARGRVAELLLETTREQISVSLNVVGSEQYARVMRTTGRNYDRVLDNVRALVAARKAQGSESPKVTIQFLVYDETFRRLPEMLVLGQELGVDRLVFNPLLYYNAQSWELLANADGFLEEVERVFREDVAGIVADVRTIDPALNERIGALRRRLAPQRYPIIEQRLTNYSSLQSFCSLPWFNMHVKATGDVYPCCALLNPQFRPFGNVRRQTLREVWLGDPYRLFRGSHAGFTRAVRDGDQAAQRASGLPPPCTVHGMCFLRALPYLDDTQFAVDVDALGRSYPQIEVSLPEVVRDGEPAVITGPDPAVSGTVEVFVNRSHCGRAVRGEGGFTFDFLPDPLPAGYHLIEVREGAHRVLAARMVRKEPTVPV